MVCWEGVWYVEREYGMFDDCCPMFLGPCHVHRLFKIIELLFDHMT